ncbi:MAG: Wzz/FepE/Etk N-terminal domain-containing protein [Bdellovibrionota bacterium]|jgi:uncharacterized protein involved in exopolysaccharide biosynthesis
MDEQTIDFRDIFALLLRNFWTIFLISGFCIGIATALTYVLPKRYKSKGVISIQASYFQNPLVNSLITDVYDPSELKGQRQALLQQALTLEFIDDFGKDFGEFSGGVSREQHALEREKLLKRIDLFGIGANAFQVSVVAGDRQKALDMTKAVIKQMEKVVIKQRNDTLLSTRAAIENHIIRLGKVLADSEESGPSRNVVKVKKELEKIEGDIALLLQHFTDKHPEVQRLRAKAKILRERYQALPQPQEVAKDNTTAAMFLADSAQKPVREVYDELLKKITNIDIVLDIEKNRGNVSYFSITEQPALPASPVFPNKLIFIAFGAMVGMLLSAIVVAFLEFKRGTFISPYYISDQLDMPLLGELPYDPVIAQELILLDSVDTRRGRKLLPKPSDTFESSDGN